MDELVLLGDILDCGVVGGDSCFSIGLVGMVAFWVIDAVSLKRREYISLGHLRLLVFGRLIGFGCKMWSAESISFVWIL